MLQLLPRRQLTIDEQIRRLDECGLLRHFLDGNAPVAQDAALAIDESDFALARAGVAVAVIEGDVSGLRAQIGDIHRLFVFRADDDRQIANLAVNLQPCCIWSRFVHGQ